MKEGLGEGAAQVLAASETGRGQGPLAGVGALRLGGGMEGLVRWQLQVLLLTRGEASHEGRD